MVQAVEQAVNWVEQGLVPDRVIRLGIRRLLRERLAEVCAADVAAACELGETFIAALPDAQIAPLPEKANQQHYEIPAEFFAAVLGPQRKYSCCLWPDGCSSLAAAETAALELSAAHAGLADGQRILELGCGWGSFSLWTAQRFPNAHITALSNSASQREAIQALAQARGVSNLEVLTGDFNNFDTGARFDRVVSIEMFEHLRNWPQAFARVARWLVPGGRFFMHVFVHGGAPYAFNARDASDWMSRHFFSGGMMPSDALAARCQDHLRLARQWRWDGRHYQRTAEAWLARMDAAEDQLRPLFQRIYGADAERWWMRWRLFFMSVAELFGFDQGQRWFVSHYLFERRD
ncbi:MAG: class I SAM-dependent methyltransferase [Rhodocyclaceae bacterium]|nr:class I SAM-dependent methyltransferase [Rhodocyclaceae bacterium]MBX3669645.1 class I SAM-dependent methyltransferase [Rhodocyclaceae bacterium]